MPSYTTRSALNRGFVLVMLVLIGYSSTSTGSAAGRLPSAQELVDGVRAWRESIHNTHSVTLWEDEFHRQMPEPQRITSEKSGVIRHEEQEELSSQMSNKRWSRVTIDLDELGRVRYREEKGTYTTRGERLHQLTCCHVYNGEITVVFDFNYDILDGTGAGRDTLAMIYDGPFPRPRGPAMMRNAISLGASGLLSGWNHLDKSGETSVQPTPDGEDGVFELVYNEKATPKGTVRRHHTVVDVSRGFLVLADRTTDTEERPFWSLEIEYAEAPEGIWLPKRGVQKKLKQGTIQFAGKAVRVPAFETRFLCEEIAVNAAVVPEELFHIRLAPGTYVHDLRFNVSYQVGAEDAIDHKLAELALRAREEQEKDPLKDPGKRALAEKMGATAQLDAGRRDRLVWMGFGTFTAALLVAMFLLWMKRLGKRG